MLADSFIKVLDLFKYRKLVDLLGIESIEGKELLQRIDVNEYIDLENINNEINPGIVL